MMHFGRHNSLDLPAIAELEIEFLVKTYIVALDHLQNHVNTISRRIHHNPGILDVPRSMCRNVVVIYQQILRVTALQMTYS